MTGHHQVEHYDIRTEGSDAVERRNAIARLAHHIAFAGEQVVQESSNAGLVVDDQYALGADRLRTHADAPPTTELISSI